MKFSQYGIDEQVLVVDINTTPLIDVMLVLLIMLIVTIPLQTNATKMNLPVGVPPARHVVPNVVKVGVEVDGTVTWNDERLPDPAAVEQHLRQAAASQPQPELHLKPEKLVAYRHVLVLLAAAQRLGLTRIGLVGNDRFAQ